MIYLIIIPKNVTLIFLIVFISNSQTNIEKFPITLY